MTSEHKQKCGAMLAQALEQLMPDAKTVKHVQHFTNETPAVEEMPAIWVYVTDATEDEWSQEPIFKAQIVTFTSPGQDVPTVPHESDNSTWAKASGDGFSWLSSGDSRLYLKGSAPRKLASTATLPDGTKATVAHIMRKANSPDKEPPSYTPYHEGYSSRSTRVEAAYVTNSHVASNPGKAYFEVR